MNEALRERCRRFVAAAPPPGLGHVADSVAERVLRGYAAGTAPDDETLELLEIVVADSRETAEALSGPAAEYLVASAALLEEIAGGA
jgi:hypothetical protein